MSAIRDCLLLSKKLITQTLRGRLFNFKTSDVLQKITRYTQSSSSNARNQMMEILQHKFPKAQCIDVVDVSGGCGAMFEVKIESVEFKGLSIVKQHRLINDSLKEQIKEMHGIRIQTSVPAVGS